MYRMNGKTWLVALVNPSDSVLTRSDGSRTVGMCDRDSQTVYIANNLHGGFLRKVLLHEVTHSAIFSYGIDMSVEQEELFCDLLATYGDDIFTVVDNIFSALAEVA